MLEIDKFPVNLADGHDVGDIIATALGEVAPAIDIPALPRDAALRLEAKLDGMDFLARRPRDTGRRRFPGTCRS